MEDPGETSVRGAVSFQPEGLGTPARGAAGGGCGAELRPPSPNQTKAEVLAERGGPSVPSGAWRAVSSCPGWEGPQREGQEVTVSGAGGRPEPTAGSSLAPLPLAWLRQVQPPQGHRQGLPGTEPGPWSPGVRAWPHAPLRSGLSPRISRKQTSSSKKPPGNSGFGYFFFCIWIFLREVLHYRSNMSLSKKGNARHTTLCPVSPGRAGGAGLGRGGHRQPSLQTREDGPLASQTRARGLRGCDTWERGGRYPPAAESHRRVGSKSRGVHAGRRRPGTGFGITHAGAFTSSPEMRPENV